MCAGGGVTGNLKQELERLGSIVQTTVGCSMDPLLSNRQSLVRIEWVGTPAARDALARFDIVLFERPNGKNILHRILRVRDDHFVICGDNQWSSERIPKDWVYGRVTDYRRAGSHVWKPVSSRAQIAYAHLWCDAFPVRATVLHACSLVDRMMRQARTTRKPRNGGAHE